VSGAEVQGASIPQAGANPFTWRTALGLVLFGSVVFVALLWMIGNGFAEGSVNDGGGHADGRGLNGYAALAQFLERRGFVILKSRTEESLSRPGLLVLTPPAQADGKTIERIVAHRRYIGPTLVITPKWATVRAPPGEPRAKSGWVHLAGQDAANWRGFLDAFTLENVGKGRQGDRVRWIARGVSGTFPHADTVMAGKGPGMVPLVMSADGRDVFAAYLDDGDYPALAARAPTRWPTRSHADEDGETRYPLIVVFDPDLLDNYGMAREPSAHLADALALAALEGGHGQIVFDLTLNGIKGQASLLTLAFTPPFLAATLCLLLAAGAVGWRAFLRFGPPGVPGRAIAFGKRALVTNAAGLIVRSRRYHLLGAPYAEAVRQRLARAFALPRTGDVPSELAALDRAARAAGAGDHAFSQAADRLGQARNARDLVKAATDLHALERTLTR
jgi:hypothetical protein